MASLALVSYEISVQDAGGYPVYRAPAPRRFSPGAGTNGVQQYVTLTASVYTALTIPAGAKFLAIFLGQRNPAGSAVVTDGEHGERFVPLQPADQGGNDDQNHEQEDGVLGQAHGKR